MPAPERSYGGTMPDSSYSLRRRYPTACYTSGPVTGGCTLSVYRSGCNPREGGPAAITYDKSPLHSQSPEPVGCWRVSYPEVGYTGRIFTLQNPGSAICGI